MNEDPPGPQDPAVTRHLPPWGSTRASGKRAFGPYRLLQLLGEGGMGEVWLAQQESPVRRKVAVKLLRAGMDSKRVVARFEAERQALAIMDHPAIAKVFDAGTTPEGRPFVVMEHVPGLPIGAHCDLHRLSTRERLELFLRVCEGVQHAHHKAVIHRDLKPSNVLVAMQDGKAAPKIIDFGLAKALAQPLTERSLFTEVGSLVGTPEYMSPEQAQPTAQDIDTRSDVYSLGVILYELLVGALPFDSEALRAAGFAGVLLTVVSQEPAKPSKRFAGLAGAESLESARRRRVDVPTLERQLAGDLDWITMRALEKDRSLRYGSPAELAADIQRHLSDQPVLARPPSAAYRARKFARRHTAAVSLSAAGLLLLLVFATAMAWQAQRIAQERDRANREAETTGRALAFLTDLFEVADPSEARGSTITAREVLDRGVDRLDSELAEEAAVQARLMLTMGNVYRNLGLGEPAVPLLARSLELRRELLGDDHPETLQSLRDLAVLLREQGRLGEAEPHHLEALERRRKVLGEGHVETLQSINDLGVMLHLQGKLSEAEGFHRQALEGRRRALGSGHLDTLESSNNLGSALWAQGRRGEAEPLLRQALEGYHRTLGDDHPRTLHAMTNVSALLKEQGRRDEAETYLRRVLEGHRRVLGDDHPRTLVAISNLGVVLQEQGRREEAESHYQEALEGRRRTLGEDHPHTLQSMNAMGALLLSRGELGDAERYFRATLEGRRRALGKDHPETLKSVSNLGALLQAQGNMEEAERHFREALEGRLRTLGEDHPDALHSMSEIGVLLASRDELEAAEPYLRQVAEGRRRTLGDEHRRTLRAVGNLGNLLRRQGELDAAEPLLLEALEGSRRTLGDRHSGTLHALLDLAALRRDQGQIEGATRFSAEALESARDLLPEGHPDLGEALKSHGRNLALAGRHDEAEAALIEAHEILAAAGDPLAREAAQSLAELRRD